MVTIRKNRPGGNGEINNIHRLSVDIFYDRWSLEMKQILRPNIDKKAMFSLRNPQTIDQKHFSQIFTSTSRIFNPIFRSDILTSKLYFIDSTDNRRRKYCYNKRIIAPTAWVTNLIQKTNRRIQIRKRGSSPTCLIITMIVKHYLKIKT